MNHSCEVQHGLRNKGFIQLGDVFTIAVTVPESFLDLAVLANFSVSIVIVGFADMLLQSFHAARSVVFKLNNQANHRNNG